jgi:uncharacterized protein RhaS with RHS repeats
VDAIGVDFVAKDPIDFAGGDTNLYGYSMLDPVNSIDPSGLDFLPLEDPNENAASGLSVGTHNILWHEHHVAAGRG